MTMPAFFEPDPPRPFSHTTVMTREVVAELAPEDGAYLDVTAGGGGHSEALLQAAPAATVIAADRDPAAVQAARARLEGFGERARVVQASFSEIPEVMSQFGLAKVAGLIADLGTSSHQLDDPARGMSFRSEGPLDMRMDPTSGSTARELIEELDQDELADVIYQLGEERRSRRVARCIKQSLERGELETTMDLRRAVVRAVGPRRVGGIDPATRTFQALRIAVNQELDELKALLALAPDIIQPDGVIVVISFHSLEDRLVKHALRVKPTWQPLHKKPLIPAEEERAENARARSAKLRAARRLTPEA